MKHPELPSERVYVRKYMRRTRPHGTTLLITGAVMLLMYSFTELFTRYEAVDGLIEAYFKLAKSAGVPFMKALRFLFETASTRADMFTFCYLALTALTSLYCIFTVNTYSSAWLSIPAAVSICLYQIHGSWLFSIINTSDYVKFAACSLITIGSSIKLINGFLLKSQAKIRYLKLSKNLEHRYSGKKASTLIPVRQHSGRR